MSGIESGRVRRHKAGGRTIAFFDFDGTLTRHDSFLRFALHAVGRVRLLRALLLASPRIAAWKLGLTTNSRAKECLFGLLYKGMDAGEFERLCESFAKKIDADLNPEAVEALRRHRTQGDDVVIVSAGIAQWIKPWAEANGVDCVIATGMEIDSAGRLTGRFSTPNCHGQEKVRRISEVYGDLRDAETWGYGDSDGDRAMLAMVNHPVGVGKGFEAGS